MTVTVTLTVKGTRYHGASTALADGSLSPGAPVRLMREPHNPHDRNAVAIHLSTRGTMLGHVSREMAPKYSSLVARGQIREACVAGISQEGDHTKIQVRVTYDELDSEVSLRQGNRFWHSSGELPPGAGVYAIQNTSTGRQYIGSSANMKDRARDHLRELMSGTHTNHALVNDFRRFGADLFEVRAVREVHFGDWHVAESEAIQDLLQQGASLYNLTPDGQGSPYGYRPTGMAVPISDREYLTEQTRTEIRRSLLLAPERRKIHDRYDPLLAALLPPVNFWVLFLVVLVPAALSLDALTPTMKWGMLLLVAVVISALVANFITTYVEKRAKSGTQYRSLLRERDDALAALERDETLQ